MTTQRSRTVRPLDARRALGEYGERVACAHLVRRGMRVVERNWRCREGEIDIVALDGDCLVVVEVKTRRVGSFVAPVDAVDPRKAARLRRLAGAYLADHRDALADTTDVRIDVVAVLARPGVAAQLEHLPGVA